MNKILIVDDHPILRLGLTSLINSEQELTVCAEADSCESALRAIKNYDPDLVLVDLALKNSDGLELIKKMKIRHPKIPSLVLSMQDEAVYAERALRAGACGFISKSQIDGNVLLAVHQVLKGTIYMSENLAMKLASKFVDRGVAASESPLDVLSDRELQVYGLVGQGRSTRQIAKLLNLSVKTVESHREHIKHKLNFESGAELNRRATLWFESTKNN